MQENIIEIDSELYERLAIWSKECGQDNVNEFIINLLLSAAKQDQEIEKKIKERGKRMKNEKNKMKKVEKTFC
jgi:negative regulator of replication initiation